MQTFLLAETRVFEIVCMFIYFMNNYEVLLDTDNNLKGTGMTLSEESEQDSWIY